MTQKEREFCEKVVMLSVMALAALYTVACILSVVAKLRGGAL